jgi:resolvase-like protein
LASPKTLGNLIAATAKPSYARVSTGDPNPELQLDALKAAGCERLFVEKASGAQRERPELIAALTYVRAGDAVVVWKLDRLARSMKQLIETVEGLEAKAIGFGRAELGRRRQAPPAELILVRAAAACRLNAADEALTRAGEGVRAPVPEIATRAQYIRGAVLADRGDAQGLAQALAAIPPSTKPDQDATGWSCNPPLRLRGVQAWPSITTPAASASSGLPRPGCAQRVRNAHDVLASRRQAVLTLDS